MKRFISILLASVILFSALLTACANQTPTGGQTSSDPQSSATPSESGPDDSGYIELGIPKKDYDGRAIRFMSRGTIAGEALNQAAVDITSEGLTADVLNNAVFVRNEKIKELYNITIENYTFDEPYKQARNMIMSDLYDAEIVTDAIEDIAGLAAERKLYDLNSFVKYTDFSKPWWDQQCKDQTSVLGYLFYMCGGITIMDNKATWAVTFNKDIISEYNLKSPYASVDDKTWTYDQMYYLMQAVTDDLDGNDTMDENDQWGLITQNFNQYVLVVGSGARICDKDAEDRPYYSFYNDRNILAFEQAVKINNAKEYVYSKYGGGIEQKQLFYKGHALFILCSMSMIQWMRPYETDFGVLPLPMLDETQDSYYSCISPSHYCVYCVPASVPTSELEFVDIMLETFAAYSYEIVEPAFYDQVLVGQGLRDIESEPMLDIIFSNVVYDLGAIYQWGGIYSILGSATPKKVKAFTGKLQNGAASVSKDVNKFIDLINTSQK